MNLPGPNDSATARYWRTVTQPRTWSEVPRAFRTVHPLGWTIWKGETIAPTEEELLTGIQG
jgi:hypothetical protein